MQDHKKNRFSLTAMAAVTGIILAAGGGAAWWAKSSLQKANITQPNPAPIVKEETPSLPNPITQERLVEVCWLNPEGNKIQLVSKTMTFQKSVKSKRVLETALETLLSEPPAGSGYTTAIPIGTKLLNLKTDKEGIHLNLSKEFISGGGSASMSSRLAQIIFTATSSSSSAESSTATPTNVWISIEGKALKNLGEEGIIVNQPMTKQDFKNNFTL